ncbi:MAG: lytic transglycosylase domain-containing protein, partial [Pseudomonadota bacterium]
VEEREFDAARALEADIDDPAARDVVVWARLRARDGDWADYEAFLTRNPDWPGLAFLRRQGEYAIPRNADPGRVVAYFDGAGPQTGTGALRLAEALIALGDDPAPVLVEAWTRLTLSPDEEAAFLARHGDLLEDHHIVRLDFLLWAGEDGRAERMLPRVPDGWRRLAEARVALQSRANGVDARIAAVPEDLAGDPGLAFDRVVWRMRSGFWDTATDLVEERSTSAASLGRPEIWADRRATLARDVMRDRDYARGYTLAANHFIDPQVDYLAYADLEWLAGYAALRLDRAEDAIRHFSNFREVVFSPISVGRAGYWLGRAHEAAGNDDAAAEAYALGAQYQSSFYGQLAAERGGIPMDPAFLADEAYPSWREQAFLDSTVLQAALTLYQAGDRDLAERFLTHLTESLDRGEAGSLGDLALDLGDPHIALRIAKRAAQSGYEIMRAYYPLDPILDTDLPVPTELALAVARRESEFDPVVRSGAGALGLMQVMPRTGRETAGRLDVEFDERRLLTDPAYNLLLGAGYLDVLIALYGDNPVLIAAAYNAGPSRANAWIERFGDPRDPDVDIVDWIEAIPFNETRNYIMRVTESLAIYEAQLTGSLPEIGLTDRLTQR